MDRPAHWSPPWHGGGWPSEGAGPWAESREAPRTPAQPSGSVEWQEGATHPCGPCTLPLVGGGGGRSRTTPLPSVAAAHQDPRVPGLPTPCPGGAGQPCREPHPLSEAIFSKGEGAGPLK